MAHLEALNFQMPSAFKDTWRGALAGHGLLPRELSRGFRQGPWVKNAQSNSCRTCILWASLSFRSGDLKDWSQICLRIVKLPRNAYACLHREPVNTNVSASAGSTWVPHTRRFLHFKKKNMAHLRIGGFRDTLQAILGNCWNAHIDPNSQVERMIFVCLNRWETYDLR